MNYRECDVSVAELPARVREEAERTIPLGAHASANVVQYTFLEREGALALRARVRDGETLVSSTPSFPMFDWDEREMRDERGVQFVQIPDERPLFIEHGRVPEARTASGRGVTTIVVGPVHAGIIEPGRFTISSAGESIAHLDAQLSYSRRGIERALEGMHVLDAAPLVATICAACSVSRSWAYARCIEALGDCACTPAAEFARLIFAELERLYNHLFDLASASAGAGFARGQLEGLRLKERVMRLCGEHTGHRFMFDAVQPGGVRAGVLADPAALRASLRAMRPEIERYGTLLFETRSLVARFSQTGIVSPERAGAFGAVGPALRASGGRADVRTHAPYGAYCLIRPEVPYESAGDVLARARVKYREMLDSLRMCDLALAELGASTPDEPEELSFRGGRWTAVTEGARGATVISLGADMRGSITRMHCITGSYRTWPLVARAMEHGIVPDFPLVNKSFNLCYACADR